MEGNLKLQKTEKAAVNIGVVELGTDRRTGGELTVHQPQRFHPDGNSKTVGKPSKTISTGSYRKTPSSRSVP